ncbi:MAG TPA: hypothetical protein VKI61_06320 [Chitinophagaceae bacterium]|nr:hypothetical protein [Chitinophagaceae bacterium]
MNLKIFFAVILLLSNVRAKSQTGSDVQIDTLFEKKISIKGFCLCKTKLSDLQNSYKDLKEIEVEELDLGKRCTGGDSRYTNEKGYYTEKYPGIIFQKDHDKEYISKFRLTKDFVGNLPNGTSINLSNLLLKEIIKQYPEPLFKWVSRDCSDYWTYSNDTVSFFLKIDRTKKPQYPLDEDYYLNRPVDAIDIFISCYSLAHKSDKFSLFSTDEPMYFIDSIRTNKAFLEEAYQPSEIAFVSIYKDSNAIKIAGKEAKNGVVYVITKSFARHHLWNYFKSKSLDYLKEVPDLDTESKIVYILNGNALGSNYEGQLFDINDSNFLELTIIDKKQLKADYNISDKKLGVVIKVKTKP